MLDYGNISLEGLYKKARGGTSRVSHDLACNLWVELTLYLARHGTIHIYE